jgi:hypothetical protein
MWGEKSILYDLQLGVKINPATGCAGKGEREEERKREYLQDKSTYRTVIFHLIYYKSQFCGRSPRERVNHIHLLLCVIDIVFF